MNKQELLKQADYNFQRGNRELARKYLAELLTAHPNEESAWILLAKVVEEKERKIECYERALKINPGNNEIKIAIVRLKYPNQTYDAKRGIVDEDIWHMSKPIKNLLRSTIIAAVIVLGLGTTTYAVARNNPESGMAKLIIPATPTSFVSAVSGDVASDTRAEVSAKYPQYVPLVDSLISLAVSNAENGMDGAPERPGSEIVAFDGAGEEARLAFESSMPQPGSLSSIVLSEQQVTSWLAMEMQNSPDLPLSNVQVYLRDDRIQIWSIVEGSDNSTSALIIGKVSVDGNGNPYFEIESAQIGQQTIPDILLSQAESWLNQLLVEEINKQASGLKIMNVKITSGLITISGMR